MTRQQRWAEWRDRIRPAMLLFFVFLAAMALTGGTSRPDSFSQPLARLAAVVAIAGFVAAPWPYRGQALRPAFGLLGLLALVTLVQVLPMPVGWWSALPGHAPYLASADAAGIAQPWRPISLVPDRTWNSLFALLVPLAALTGLAHLSSRGRAALLLPVAVLALASAVYGLAQMSGGPDSVLRPYQYSSDQFAAGFFANRNHQALLLACALPVLAAWATVPDLKPEARRMRAYVSLGVAAFLLLMLPTTGSRAGLALAVLGLIVAIALAVPTLRRMLARRSSRSRRRIVAYGVGGVVAFVALLTVFGRNEAIRRLYELNTGEDIRVQALPVVLRMTREFFPTGIGIGTFEIVYRRFEPFDQLATQYLNQAHNDILQLVLEGGLAAALLLAGAAIWWLVASWRAWRAPPSAERQAARAGSAILLMALAASIVDYPVRTPLMMVVIAIAGAWLLTPERRAGGEGDDPR